MSSIRVPQGFWVALAVVFAILTLLFLIKGMFIMVIVALAAAIWTGLEASGNGAFSGRDHSRSA
jgi:hypothetical protein